MIRPVLGDNLIKCSCILCSSKIIPCSTNHKRKKSSSCMCAHASVFQRRVTRILWYTFLFVHNVIYIWQPTCDLFIISIFLYRLVGMICIVVTLNV